MPKPLPNQPPVEWTRKFVAWAFDGIIDKGGKPYLDHLLRVEARITDATEEERHIALLHDIVEDLPCTFERLASLGYRLGVLRGVDFLTRRPNQTYKGYIGRLLGSGNQSIMRVKLSDAYDNSSPARSVGMPISLVPRYRSTVEKLRNALPPEAYVAIVDGDFSL